MIAKAIQRKAAERAGPGLYGSCVQLIEVHKPFPPALFGFDRDRGARNQPEFHCVGGQGLQKSDELCVAGKSSGKAKVASMRRGR
jgi:hypothetical protein